jgi:hypothetical protein
MNWSSDDDFYDNEDHRDLAVGPAAQRNLAALSDSDGEDEPLVPAPLPLQRRQRCYFLPPSICDSKCFLDASPMRIITASSTRMATEYLGVTWSVEL